MILLWAATYEGRAGVELGSRVVRMSGPFTAAQTARAMWAEA